MEERKVTVYRGSTKDYSPFPRITLQGQWLDSLGFSIGDRLTVGCERGRIIIEKDVKAEFPDGTPQGDIHVHAADRAAHAAPAGD